VGLSNLYAIVEAADGAIVGRDDLSVWTDAETLRRETYRVLRCCREHGRIAVTASNYFASVCDGPALNDRDREELAGVLALAPDYLYCNETSTSRRERDAWVLAAARSSGLI
jgi:pyruvate kinase